MDPELRQMLLETAALTKENNKMLRRLQSAGRWGRVFSVLRYLLIAALAFGAYYYLEPYIKNLTDAFNKIVGGVDTLKNFKPF